MTFRVSTSMTYQTASYSMNQTQNSLLQLQQQLSTMKRVNVPADDPVAAAQIVSINQAIGINAQFITNSQTVQSVNQYSATALGSVTDSLQNVKDLALQAGNNSLNDANLKQLGAQLQGDFSQILAAANATDTNGNSLFSGSKVGTVPYASTGWNVTYQGDNGQQTVGISSTRQVPTSDPGSTIFGTGTADTSTHSMFKALSDLNTLLTTGRTANPNFSTDLNTVLNEIDSSLQNVLTVQAAVGARVNEGQAVQSTATSFQTNNQTQLSNLQDLDIGKASTQLSLDQFAYQASISSFAKIQSLSLFSVIG